MRWDSLGEFLALAVSLQHLSEASGNAGAKVMGDALDEATAKLLENAKSPSRKVRELDNRGSQFYLTLYWAQALASQDDDVALKQRFAPLAKRLAEDESKIIEELNSVQGRTMDIGGYYSPDAKLASEAMRPSSTFNAALASLT